jgi:hypothetical protein
MFSKLQLNGNVIRIPSVLTHVFFAPSLQVIMYELLVKTICVYVVYVFCVYECVFIQKCFQIGREEFECVVMEER